MFELPSPRHLAAGLALTSGLLSVGLANPIQVDGNSFALNGNGFSYRFHVDKDSKDLITDHYGGPVDESGVGDYIIDPIQGWQDLLPRQRREFADIGRGDFRSPAYKIRQSAGYTVSEFQYKSHEIVKGKPSLKGLPSTFGSASDVSTLIVHLYDNYSSVAADLSYSVFPQYDAIVRSVSITNHGKGNITVEKLTSFSLDMPYEDLEMIELNGDWARDGRRARRKIEYGTQGFGSTMGFTGHLHNNGFLLVSPSTTESQGEAFGFSLVYTGSFSVEVEKGSQGLTRANVGMHPDQLSWSLGPGQTLTSPECVSIYSSTGVGGMSRKMHKIFQKHLIKSKLALKPHPILFNSWEGLEFDYNDTTIYRLAQETAGLGFDMLALDDGWFGVKYPRVTDNAGLGDWVANPARFPHGLPHFIKEVTDLKVTNSTKKLLFGLWFEPEMVNPNSTLYHEHPDWALHAGPYPRTLTRSQLILNLALPEVQEYIIKAVSDILKSAPISYVKYDHNRGIHEAPYAGFDHAYMLGMYHVFEVLTTRFPDVLWEGCASGGGRFDPGVLQYFPHIWTSDDTDAVERLSAQFGMSIFYPTSAMGAHVSPIPNGNTGRTESIMFRAHVAMMSGSFGFELNPAKISDDDKAQIPEILALARKTKPYIDKGDLYRLNLPEESNWPAALFIAEDGCSAVLFYFQIKSNINNSWPFVRLQGLDPKAMYSVDGSKPVSGRTLMNIGLQYEFHNDWDSRVVFIVKV